MFPFFGALILSTAAATGAWFVHLSAEGQSGRLRTAGRVLSIWLVVLAVLTLVGGLFAAIHGPRGMGRGFGPRAEMGRMHGGPGRFGPGMRGRGPWMAPASPPAPVAPSAPAAPAAPTAPAAK